ncbi:MAG: NUDIX domain-containing protein [Propionibacteriales bacterium]|nr:NUDIX domain-containing protein [Propionibacteriales bacterium]
MPMLYVVAHQDEQSTSEFAVPHGAEPQRVLAQHGWQAGQPIEATRRGDDLVITFRATPALRTDARRVGSTVRRDRDLVVRPGETPMVKQRLAAYAIVQSARGVLATQYSARTAVEARWGLPGGGMDPGEDPRDTVRREVWEETGQDVTVGDLLEVGTSHWIGRGPDGALEDFQAVRLTYRATCPRPIDTVVHDIDGTTADARWLTNPYEVDWADPWRARLPHLLQA